MPEINLPKTAGWVLLITGVGIIMGALLTSHSYFGAKKPFPQLFSLPKEVSAPPQIPEGRPEEMVQYQMEKTIQEGFRQMIPSDVLPKLLNMVCWSLFMGIVVFAGSQIAFLGIKLLKS